MEYGKVQTVLSQPFEPWFVRERQTDRCFSPSDLVLSLLSWVWIHWLRVSPIQTRERGKFHSIALSLSNPVIDGSFPWRKKTEPTEWDGTWVREKNKNQQERACVCETTTNKKVWAKMVLLLHRLAFNPIFFLNPGSGFDFFLSFFLLALSLSALCLLPSIFLTLFFSFFLSSSGRQYIDIYGQITSSLSFSFERKKKKKKIKPPPLLPSLSLSVAISLFDFISATVCVFFLHTQSFFSGWLF